MKQNMAAWHRVLYLVTGVVMIVAPFGLALSAPLQWIIPIAGVLSLISSATGH